jgi:two-component system, response regulator / RNA-binding antiterminator
MQDELQNELQNELQDAMRQAVSAGVACYVVNGLENERIQPLLQLAQIRFKAWQAMRDDTTRAPGIAGT